MVKNKLLKIIKSREFILLFSIIALLLFFGLKSEHFLKVANINALLLNISVYSIIGAGMTFLFMTGGMDISTGTNIAFLSIILGIMLSNNMPIPLAILITLLLGTVIGLIIGLLVTKFNIDPLIITLGAMFIFKGLAFIIGINSKVNSTRITPTFSGFSEKFLAIGGTKIFGIESISYYMLAIIIIGTLLIWKNTFFRQSIYIGDNDKASKLVGMKVDFIKIFGYCLTSFLVAVATVLRVSRVGAASSATGGTVMGVTIIVAVILGGASLSGGSGSIPGTFLAIIVLTIIQHGIDAIGFNVIYSSLFLGLIILFTVYFDSLAKRKLSDV